MSGELYETSQPHDPIDLYFASVDTIRVTASSGKYRPHAQPLPFLMAKGSLITRLRLTVVQYPETDEITVHVNYLVPIDGPEGEAT